MKRVLVTGGAGFIGSHLVDQLILENQFQVTCLDNFDDYYDPLIKRHNIKHHLTNPNFELVEADIQDIDSLERSLNNNYDYIIHLAAKAGVRPSLENPLLFQKVNQLGMQNLLELAKKWNTKQFIFASSSSVYGVNAKVPWSEEDNVLQPISPYAVSKIAGELLGHVYSKVYGIRFIALRFFTVYGPRQRPDLAINKFLNLIIQDKPIEVFGDGSTRRDYTYVQDIVRGIRDAMDYTKSLYEIINLGNNHPLELIRLIQLIEKMLDKKAIIKYKPEQPGDVPQTFADITKAKELLGYSPSVDMETGLKNFYEWIMINK